MPFYSTKELKIIKNPETTSIATGSNTSITAGDTKEDKADKPGSKTGSILGSNDSLLDDKI